MSNTLKRLLTGVLTLVMVLSVASPAMLVRAEDAENPVLSEQTETQEGDGTPVNDVMEDPTEEPTEDPTEGPTEEPTEEAATYTVTLDGQGKAAFESIVVNPGEALGELPWGLGYNATYILNGWKDAEGNPVTASTVVEGDTTIYADWIRVPGSGSGNVTKELFTIQCSTCAEHKWLCNWFGSHVKLVSGSVAWDGSKWTAKATFSSFSLINTTTTRNNYFGGKTHYYEKNLTIEIPMYYSATATGLNSEGKQVTGLWLPMGSVVANVYCYSAPAAPSTTTVQKLDKIIWTHENGAYPDGTKATSKYVTSRKLIAGTYTLGDVYEKDGVFYCDLTITDLNAYLNAFATKYGEGYHIDTIHSQAQYKYVLKYTGSTTDYKQDGTGWTVDASSYASNKEKLNGKDLWVTNKYTVTYTDGVEGEELFADQSYIITYGDATPGYEGTPTRENWNFVGWTPDVSDTVTGDVVYTAQWEKATNNMPPASKHLKTSDVDKMQIRVYGAGTEPYNPNKEMYSCSPSIKAKGVSYVLSGVTGNDVDGYFQTVTFTFNHGDAMEAAASNVFNTGFSDLKKAGYTGNWTYCFTSNRPQTQTLTLKWVVTSGTLPNGRPFTNAAWKPVLKDGTTGNNITAQIANIIQVEVQLLDTVTYTDGVDDAELFADQSYVVRRGSATPAFSGTPERPGYIFDGWTPDVSETVMGNATYTAVWKPAEFTITLDPGQGAVSPKTVTVTYGEPIGKLPGAVQENWVFVGWEGPDGHLVAQSDLYLWTEDVTFVARWGKPADPESPPLGDSSNIALWACVAVVSAMAIVALPVYRKFKA